ncbi:MAG: hypothetical protein WCG25_05220 [bacterium]
MLAATVSDFAIGTSTLITSDTILSFTTHLFSSSPSFVFIISGLDFGV